MRILHIDTVRGWRGGERQTLWLAQSLDRRGHHSIVAARPGEPLARHAREVGLDVAPCVPRFEADPSAALALRRLLAESRIATLPPHTGPAAGPAPPAPPGTGASPLCPG